MSAYTPYHSLYLANRITLEGVSDDAFAKSLSTARVEMNPHQVDAALFALQPPIHRGAILADEVGHYVETPTKYRARVSKGFQVLDRINFKVADPKAVKDFRAQVVPVADTRRHVFGGFKRCLYPHQSFQSDEERRFAVLIDSDHEPEVLRWVSRSSWFARAVQVLGVKQFHRPFVLPHQA
jgi:hypothetical protein